MSIVYIILCYTPDKELLRKNLKLLHGKQVVVVNNNPENTFIEIITGTHITIIHTKENTGYAEGMNRGMTYAWKHGAEWVVLLNDDVEVTEAGLHALDTSIQKLLPGVYGPETGKLDKKRWTTYLQITDSNNHAEYISGSIFCIHKLVDNKMKGFYKGYFMYYEDVEYCLRAKLLGFPVLPIVLPFIHHHAIKKEASYSHEYYLARNHVVFVRRNGSVAVKLYEILRLPKTILEHVITKNTAALAGVVDGYLGRLGRR